MKKHNKSNIRKQIKKAMKTNLSRAIIAIDKILFLIFVITYSMLLFTHLFGNILVAAQFSMSIFAVSRKLVIPLFK